jgi:DNA processing protein
VADPEADLLAAERHGMRPVVPESADWPHFAFAALERAVVPRAAAFVAGRYTRRESGEPVPPVALWVRGTGDLATVGVRSVGIVGARAATAYGEHVTADLAHGLAGRDVVVVSGGAYGIDAAAHRGALAGGGLTIAIVAGGLRRPYPRAHEALFARIGRDGLIVSEFPPDATPQRHRFLVRNRLVAALTAGTVVVEAGVRSGALATARQGLRMGRAVMAVPGPVTSHASAGVHLLLRVEPEVVLVTRTAEVVEEVGLLGTDLADRPQAPADPRDRLAPMARQVLDGLPTVGVAAPDRIALTCGVPPLEVLRCLPALELEGFVEATPTGWQLGPAARTRSRR